MMISMSSIRVCFFLVIWSAFGSAASGVLVVNDPWPTIDKRLQIQPIVVRNGDNSNEATFFGTDSQKALIEQGIDLIWGQAGIDIQFLSTQFISDTFTNEGNMPYPDISGDTPDPRPSSDFQTIYLNAGPPAYSNDVFNMVFVNVVPGFPPLDADTVAGLATVWTSTSKSSSPLGSINYVGSNLLSYGSSRDTIASVIAHEIGHNLGLGHPNPELTDNLMNGSNDDPGEKLTPSQINTARNSSYLTAVPEPSAFLLLSLISLVLGTARVVSRRQIGHEVSSPAHHQGLR